MHINMNADGNFSYLSIRIFFLNFYVIISWGMKLCYLLLRIFLKLLYKKGLNKKCIHIYTQEDSISHNDGVSGWAPVKIGVRLFLLLFLLKLHFLYMKILYIKTIYTQGALLYFLVIFLNFYSKLFKVIL